MQTNKMTELENLINNVTDLIVVLITSDGCEKFKSKVVSDFEEQLAKQTIPVHYHTMCYTESSLPFPRPYTPAVYYFAPKKQVPLFYRLGNAILVDVQNDVKIAKEMTTANKDYKQVAMDEKTREQYDRTEKMLETEDVSKFPPFFQQIRNLGKEMWAAGKNAARGLPVLVTADVAFERFSTCQSCEFLKDDSRCEKCGCFMKTKTQLASSSCPIGKWSSTV